MRGSPSLEEQMLLTVGPALEGTRSLPVYDLLAIRLS
jgi:hypothetical protein